MSAQTDQSETLSAEARTKQRDQSATELVRAMLIVNGGGAVALLAFLKTRLIFSTDALAKPTIIVLVILSFGAALGAAFHLFRHQASWCQQARKRGKWKIFRCLYLTSASLSLLAFPVGIGIVAIGVWNALRL